tara:strand:+ start:14803 stop:15084 length:282 start_codon:yes stop_codon:yes gene_type:complete
MPYKVYFMENPQDLDNPIPQVAEWVDDSHIECVASFAIPKDGSLHAPRYEIKDGKLNDKFGSKSDEDVFAEEQAAEVASAKKIADDIAKAAGE